MATCNNKRTLSKGLQIALIILGAFALLYVIGMAYSSWTNKRFEQNGVRTFATVTDVQVKHHPEHTSWVRGGNGTPPQSPSSGLHRNDYSIHIQRGRCKVRRRDAHTYRSSKTR